MSDTIVMILVGLLGAMCAFVERRDGWRYANLARELHDVRERVSLLERDRETAPEAVPRPWWAFWRRTP